MSKALLGRLLPSHRKFRLKAQNTWEPPVGDVASALRDVTSPTHKKRRSLGKSPTNWLAMFDWRFEYYLTPWIIRIMWITFLVLMIGMVIMNTIGVAWSMLPEASTAPSPRSQPHWGDAPTPPSGPAFPDWLTVRVAKIILYVVSIVGAVFTVVVTRMILELLMVVFRIAEDIGVLKRKYAEEIRG